MARFLVNTSRICNMSTKFFSNFFETHSNELNDIYGLDYTSPATEQCSGWEDFTQPFCDNIMLWCATYTLVMISSVEIGSYASIIRNVFKQWLDPTQYNVKYIYSAKCKDGSIPRIIHQRKRATVHLADGQEYVEAFLAFKVSFTDTVLPNLFHILRNAMSQLHERFVVLHDLDITVDAAYISTRAVIIDYITGGLRIPKEHIVKDRKKVGDNCVSWMDYTLEDIPVRVKVYNKFVQMLEIADVRSNLGTQLGNFVLNPSTAFQDRLKHYRSTGMTRIELTIFCDHVLDYQQYLGILYGHVSELQDCPTFQVPFEQQWRILVDKLQSVITVYDVATKTFGYCHWWNSLTGRKQGYFKANISESEVMKLVANYSFNDRPIYYYTVDSTKQDTVITRTIHRRVTGCTAITLVPGVGNTFYPRRTNDRIESFSTVGLITHANITIEWPELRSQRADRPLSSNALAEIVATGQQEEQAYTSELLELKTIIVSKYKADYSLLQCPAEYTAIHYGYATYRGKEYLFLDLDGDVYIRCSNTLAAIFHTYYETSKYPMRFRTIRPRKVHGTRDLVCELA